MHLSFTLLLYMGCLGAPSLGKGARVPEGDHGVVSSVEGRYDDKDTWNAVPTSKGNKGFPVSNTRNKRIAGDGIAKRALLPDGRPPGTIVLVANGRVGTRHHALAPALLRKSLVNI